MRRCRPLLLTVLLLLVGASSAQAAVIIDPRSTVTDPLVIAHLEIAAAYWQTAPDCPDGINVGRWTEANDPNVWGLATTPGCDMWLDADHYPMAADEEDPDGWRQAICTTVVHEYGHLLGHDHSDDPNSIMTPLFSFGHDYVPGCARPVAPPVVEEPIDQTRAMQERTRIGRTDAMRERGQWRLTTTVSNTGDVTATDVRVCQRWDSAIWRTTGSRCRTVARLAPGATVTLVKTISSRTRRAVTPRVSVTVSADDFAPSTRTVRAG